MARSTLIRSPACTFSRTELQVDAYHQVWKGGVMAYDLYGVFNYGNTPWTMLALMGGSTRMRGYYEGRYRDKQMIEIQAELRQKIYGRSGIAVCEVPKGERCQRS